MSNSVFSRWHEWIVRSIVKIPFFPYWLEFRVGSAAQHRVLFNHRYLNGTVLDVGCGSRSVEQLLQGKSEVRKYIGLEYPQFVRDSVVLHEESAKRLGPLSDMFCGDKFARPDCWGDGHNLPFKDSSIDSMVCFEVLEHVHSPQNFILELGRVLRGQGFLVLSTPFLYEAHSATDYWRFTELGLRSILTSCGFGIVKLYHLGGAGQTISRMLNAFLIKHFIGFHKESRSPLTLYCRGMIVAPLFGFSNIFGAVLDKFIKDQSFATRLLVVAQKH